MNLSKGKSPVKQNAIAAGLRQQIIDGKLSPGSRLPTRVELKEAYRASNMTVQIALNRLVRDGFVTADGRRGTFVAERPPHLHHVALIFPEFINLETVRFWRVLSRQADLESQRGPRKFHFYYGVNGQSDSEDYRRLMSDTASRRVGALIFASPAHVIAGITPRDSHEVPRVALASVSLDGIASVDAHRVLLFDRALEYLAARGRKRVAVIDLLHGDSIANLHHDRIAETCARLGMTTRSYWLQTVHAHSPSRARAMAHLLMHGGQTERPDALIIADDSFVDSATAGLVDAGLVVPRDIDVVAHCNYPEPPPAQTPVTRLGFDASQILHTCLDLIEAQRRGETPASITRIAPLFENEYRVARERRTATPI